MKVKLIAKNVFFRWEEGILMSPRTPWQHVRRVYFFKYQEFEIHAIFDLFDTYGNGKISKDEFITCFRRNPLLIAYFNHHFMHKDLNAETGLDEIVACFFI